MKRPARMVTAVLISLCLWFVVQAPAETHAANVPYYSYFMSPDGFLSVPAPYEPAGIISIGDPNHGSLKKPQDLFIDGEDRLYVADTGNHRIVMMDKSGNILRIFGSGENLTKENGKLADPKGVFVDKDGMVYTADTGNQRIVLFASDGRMIRALEKPQSPLLGIDFSYQPAKLIVDSRNYIYVVGQGNQKGLIMLDSEGGFRGFFGGNKVQTGLADALLRLFYTKEQRRGISNMPFSFNNVFNSADGFIYATTTGLMNKQVRKLNAIGGDALPNASRDFSDESLPQALNKQNFIDVTVDAKGNMTIIDKQFGRMYQYDNAGNMFFAFGGKGSGHGLFASPTAIEVDSHGILYVLDETRNHIQKFRPTPFTNHLHQANDLYNQGKYEEAIHQWREVLRLDSYYTIALNAMGQIRLRQENYPEAMANFKLADSKYGYSVAFYEQRRIFVSTHFAAIATSAVGGVILLFIGLKLWNRRKRDAIGLGSHNRISLLIKQLFSVMTHPAQGFEALRYEGKGKLSDAVMIIAAFTAINLLSEWGTSFLFETNSPDTPRWGEIILKSVLPWIIWSVANYGISTISEGEGRFRDVVVGTAYCMAPLLFFSLPLALLTHILTFREYNFYSLFFNILILWTIVLLFIKVKETHSYDFGKTVWITAATAVGCVIMAGLYVILYGMALRGLYFVGEIVKEVIFNVA